MNHTHLIGAVLVTAAATLYVVGEVPKLEQQAELTQCLNTLERERMELYMEQYRRPPTHPRITTTTGE